MNESNIETESKYDNIQTPTINDLPKNENFTTKMSLNRQSEIA